MLNNSDPKGAEYAGACIATLNRENKSTSARRRMAELALTRGNYTDAGRKVWREYLAAGAPDTWRA